MEQKEKAHEKPDRGTPVESDTTRVEVRPGYVYKITGPTGLSYVGLARDVELRMLGHQKAARIGDKKPLYQAIREHGWDKFTVTILESFAGIENRDLCDAERRYIQENGLHPLSYNLTHTCARPDEEVFKRVMKSVCRTPAFRAKISLVVKDLWQDSAFRAKNSAAQKTACQTASFSEKSASGAAAAWKDPVRREQHCEALTLAWVQRRQKLYEDIVTWSENKSERALSDLLERLYAQ